MNFAANSNPVLVAPRPVRFQSAPIPRSCVSPRMQRFMASESVDRMRLNTVSPEEGDIRSARPPSVSPEDSPRASPRPTLPSEAMEEFLSILRPSFVPPTSSPILRVRHRANPSFTFERPSFAHKPRFERELEQVAGQQTLLQDMPSSDPDSMWFALSTQVNRIDPSHPTPRRASYDLGFSRMSPSSILRQLTSPVSPSAVPLPLPTPNEAASLDVVVANDFEPAPQVAAEVEAAA